IAGAMSEKVVSGSVTSWNDYIRADGNLVGERSCSGASPCTTGATWQFFVTDHLGSVAVSTDGTSGSPTYGQVTQRMAFDPWGKQRNLDGSDDPTCSLGLSNSTTRGVTGHEAIASLCLINMNARIYDPTVARFVSPDSIVPDPTDGQSYNRYTYVGNRPLSLTDPSGHLAGDPFATPCGHVCGPFPDGNAPGDDKSTGKEGERKLVGTLGDINNLRGIQFANAWLSQELSSYLGSRNVSVGPNANGNLALNFTCAGNAACIQAGEYSMVAGAETFVGGEGSDAGSYVNGDSDDT